MKSFYDSKLPLHHLYWCLLSRLRLLGTVCALIASGVICWGTDEKLNRMIPRATRLHGLPVCFMEGRKILVQEKLRFESRFYFFKTLTDCIDEVAYCIAHFVGFTFGCEGEYLAHAFQD